MEEIKTLDDLIRETREIIYAFDDNFTTYDEETIVKGLAIFLEARDLLRENGYYAELKKIDNVPKENQQGKFSYSFNWLRKLERAVNDEEREKILQDWLAELAHKKSAENEESN